MTQFVTIEEAVARHIHDGDVVYLAGFTHLIPMAFGHEIIRQQRRHLTLCRMTPDIIYDQMLSAGVADRVVFSYAGNPGVGLLHGFRRAVESGLVQIEEYTHFELVARLAAGAAGLPFWPLRTLANDLTDRRPRPAVQNPFGEGQVPVVSALTPDVTAVHVQSADPEGNLYAWGLLGEIREAALAARTVLASVEEIRPASELRAHRDHLLLPAFQVQTVSVVPWGAHPSYVLGYYDRDTDFYTEWDQLGRDPQAVDAWLSSHVCDVADRAAYIRLLPEQRLRALAEAAGHVG